MDATLDKTLLFNLRRLFVLRNIAIGGELAVIAIAVWVLEMALPVAALLAVVGLHGVVNLLTWGRLRFARAVEPFEFFVQIMLDVGVLFALLALSGGSTNPLVSLLLLPLVVVAAILPRRYVWAMAGVTVLAYSVLMFVYKHMPHAHSRFGHEFDLHVTGMWFSFLLSVGLIIFFVTKLAQSLRERDLHLAQAREQALRDEQLVTLGTLAAGAAHELGTPLSTMSVLVKELQHEHADDKELAGSLSLLGDQLARCKQTLSAISVSAGQSKAEGGYRTAVGMYLEQLVQQWQAARPGVSCVCDWQGDMAQPEIVADHSLTQAISNILNNAADVSREPVEILGRWDAQHVTLEVLDRGDGVSPEMRARLGKTPVVSTKQGQGVGLFLAYSVIKRLGGRVALEDRDGGGMRTLIELPLAKLLVQA